MNLANWISRYFKRPASNDDRVRCPRCLGKGRVDTADIKRLRMEIYWTTGVCAYCNATGNIDPIQLKQVDVDEAYLTIELDTVERKKLLHNNPEARMRAELYKTEIELLAGYIIKLHHDEFKSHSDIVDYLLNRFQFVEGSPEWVQARNEFLTYVEKITGL